MIKISNEQLMAEWKKHDILLDDYEGFELFCEIRLSGSQYPRNQEDIFLTVEPVRKEFKRNQCRFSLNSSFGRCIPQETSDAYWQRNDKATEIVRNIVSLSSKAQVINVEAWPLHLTTSHLQWIEDEFHLKLTEEDFKRAWSLFEHKTWFSSDGYYIRGWLAIAEALGLCVVAQRALEEGDFPHRDNPQYEEKQKCKHIHVCPIYAYREWLRLIPMKDIPDDIFQYELFQSNCNYHLGNGLAELFKQGKKKQVLAIINKSHFILKWRVLKMIHDYSQIPKCSVPGCNAISYIGIGEQEQWKDLMLCWKHHKVIAKAYREKIMPLRFEGDSTLIPEHTERHLRLKLIEGDEMFNDITNGE